MRTELMLLSEIHDDIDYVDCDDTDDALTIRVVRKIQADPGACNSYSALFKYKGGGVFKSFYYLTEPFALYGGLGLLFGSFAGKHCK
jgi:hypothetical protein